MSSADEKAAARAAAAAEREAKAAAAKAEREAKAAAAKAEKDAKAAAAKAEREAKAAAAKAEREAAAAAKAAEKDAAAGRAALLKQTQCSRKHPWTPFLAGRPLPPGVSSTAPFACSKCKTKYNTVSELEKVGHYYCLPCQLRLCFNCQPLTDEIKETIKTQAEQAMKVKKEYEDKQRATEEKAKQKADENAIKYIQCRSRHPVKYIPPSSPVQDGRTGYFRCLSCGNSGPGSASHYEDDGYWFCSTCNGAVCVACIPFNKHAQHALKLRDGDGAQVAPAPSGASSSAAPANGTCPQGHTLSLIAGGCEPRDALFTCDRCSKSDNSRWDGYWWCQECNNDVAAWPNIPSHIVGKCCLPVPKVEYHCDRGQVLQLVKEGVDTSDERLKCEDCRKQEPARLAHWTCNGCKYILCGKCGPILEEDVAKAGPVVTDRDEWKAKKVCTNNHPLQRITRKPAQGAGWDRWTCAVCKLPGSTYHAGVHACVECCFVICSKCLPSDRPKEEMVCDYCYQEKGCFVPAVYACDQCVALHENVLVPARADPLAAWCEAHAERAHKDAGRHHRKWRVAEGRKPYCETDLFDALMDAFFHGNKKNPNDHQDHTKIYEEDDDMIVAFANKWEKKVVKAGESLVRQGDAVTHLYLNLDGDILHTYEYWNDDNSYMKSLDDPHHPNNEWGSEVERHGLVAHPFWSMEKHWCNVKVELEDVVARTRHEETNRKPEVTFLALPKDAFATLPEQLQTRIREVVDKLYANQKDDFDKTISLRNWNDFASKCHPDKALTDRFIALWEDGHDVKSKEGKVRAMQVVGTPDIEYHITKNELTGIPIRRLGRVWMAVEYKKDGILRVVQGHWTEEFDGTKYGSPSWGGAHRMVGRPIRVDPKTVNA